MPKFLQSHPRSITRQTTTALLLALQVASPAFLLAQMPQPQQVTQSSANPQSTQANEATSKPIEDTPAAPMPAIEATVTQGASPLSRDERVLEVLNRFTYGPRPGDVERLRTIGLSKWFSEQFNPQSIDDSALDRRLAEYPAMKLPIGRMMEMYPDAQMIRATMNSRNGVPGGEGERQLYKTQMQRYKDHKNGKDNATSDAEPKPLPWDIPTLLAMKPLQRFNALCKLSPPQLAMLRRRIPEADRDQLTAGFTPHQTEILAAFNGPAGVLGAELVHTKLLRDIYSERQLNEVMVDFWLNHFNVYIRKLQQAPYFINAYERDTIRPRALGHFENLLVATAISPAMLNYLDNAESVGLHSPSSSIDRNLASFRRQQQPKKATGLNENYARELMELHTLGANGGYTQQDVTEVAKVFTGWTLGSRPGGGPAIYPDFDRSKHELGTKIILSNKFKEDGSNEGIKVLHMLATSPQTAHFISTKLAIRFVSDNPPPALVERMTQTFLSTNGDIRQILLTMIQSPEFFTRETYHAKVKTPQDYVISAVRASGAEVESAGALGAAIAELGMPIYGMQTPNGYSMRADPWNSTASLISRMNFALALASNWIAGVNIDFSIIIRDKYLTPQVKDKELEASLLHSEVSDRSRQAILAQITVPPDQQQTSLRRITSKGGRDALANLRSGTSKPQPIDDPQTALAAGLIFVSPEFQHR